ncbi:MAG: hypothetical protein GY719_05940 [bacterium]|nr:hypothetical protein [bacterium]
MTKKKSSKQVASEAARVLQDRSASATTKRLAGSVLSQADRSKDTGAELEDLASKVLKSPKYSEETKTLAGSVLSQSRKER